MEFEVLSNLLEVPNLDLDVVNIDCNTALHLILLNNTIEDELKEECIKALLEEGANPDVINKNGEKSKLVSVKEIIDGKLVVDERNDIIKWRDTKTPTGFKREMDNVTKYFNQDGRIEYTDGEYNLPDYPVTDIDFEVALLSTCLPAPP